MGDSELVIAITIVLLLVYFSTKKKLDFSNKCSACGEAPCQCSLGCGAHTPAPRSDIHVLPGYKSNHEFFNPPGFDNNKSGFKTVKSKKEKFSDASSAPLQAGVASLAMAGDYQNAMQKMGLEQTVSDSHKQFMDEVHHRTSTSSKMTVRTDDNDINPWVGLRRPRYNHGATPESDARTVSSETPNQLPFNKRTHIL
jgi:hypothetical protein